jgi:hypothetical protein
MRRTHSARLLTLGAALLGAAACGDASTSKKSTVDAEVISIRDLGPVVDADLSQREDATPIDFAPPPDLKVLDAVVDAAVEWDLGIRPDAGACTPTVVSDAGGVASLPEGVGDVTTQAGDDFFRVTVIDPRGRPLPGASVSVIFSAEADAFTLVAHAPGYLAAVLQAPRGDGTYGINAARQVTEGPGAKETLGASEVPGCAAGTRFVSVLAALAPLPERITRDLAGDALTDACAPGGAEPPESPACVALGRVRDAQSDLPARLRLAADSHPAYGEAALPRLPAQAGLALMGDTCGTPWGVAPVAFVDDTAAPLPDQLPLARWRRLAEVFTRQALLLNPNDAAAADRLVRFGIALGRLSGVVSPVSYDLVAADPTFPQVNGLARAAEAVRAVVAAGDAAVPADAEDTLRAFAGAGVVLDAYAFARSANAAGAYGLGPAALCDLSRVTSFLTVDADTLDVHAAVDVLLDVLEAAAAVEPPPPPADAALPPPPTDGGIAPPPDAVVAPDPDAAPVETVVCSPDDSEPNQTWQQEVAEGQRLPQNISLLRHRTLEPGDEDWYDFEAGLINRNLGATLSAEPECVEPGGRLCAELLWYTWVNAEGLLDDQPTVLVERQCADLADGLVLNAGGIGGLAGEPWTSFLVHVTEDAAAPLAAPVSYQVRATR